MKSKLHIPFTEMIHDNHFEVNYQFEYPTAPLRDYIHKYWETSLQFNNQGYLEDKLLPLPAYSLLVNLGKPYRVIVNNELHLLNDDLLLLRSVGYRNIYVPGNQLFGIHFKADLLNLFHKHGEHKKYPHLVKITEQYPLIQDLVQQLKEADNFTARTRLAGELLPGWLKKMKRAKKTQLKYVMANIHDIESSLVGTMRVAETMMDQSLSLKSFERYYLNTVGVTPKHYWRIRRLRKAIAQFSLDQKGFSSTEFGYHDYSHFYREVIELTGETPSDIL